MMAQRIAARLGRVVGIAPNPFVITSKKCPAPQEPIVVQRRRAAEAPLHDHAVAVAGPTVARRTKDVEALLPARNRPGRDRKRESGRQASRPDLAGVEQRVVVEAPRAHGAAQRPRRALVAEEGRLRAGCTSADRACPDGSRRRSRRTTEGRGHPRRTETAGRQRRATSRGLKRLEEAARASRSNFASRASTHRKNRLRLASAKPAR